MGVLDTYIGHAWEAVENLSRETVGFIPAAYKSTSANKVKFGQEIQIPYGIVGDMVDTPIGFAVPTAQTNTDSLGYVSLVINKRKTVPIDIDGEDEAGLATTGTEADVRRDQFSEAFRKIANAMEADMASAAILGSSRAVGTAGTSPFNTAGDFTTFALAQDVLDHNGASPSDRVMILLLRQRQTLLENREQCLMLISMEAQMHVCGALSTRICTVLWYVLLMDLQNIQPEQEHFTFSLRQQKE